METEHPIKLITFKSNNFTAEEKKRIMVPHSHNTIEFSYVTSGEIVLDFFSQTTGKMERTHLFAKQFFITYPGCFHAVNIPCDLSTIGMEFSCDESIMYYLSNSQYLNSLPLFHDVMENFKDVLIFNDTHNVWYQCNKLKDFLSDSNNDIFKSFLYDLELKKLAIEILKCSREPLLKLKKFNIYIKQAIRFIEANYSKNITPKNIANHLGISEVYVQKLFKTHLEMPTSEFIRRKKIDKAKMLISNSNFPFSKIAKEVGFKSPQTFISNFKKYTGQSPSDYKATEIHNNNLHLTNPNMQYDAYNEKFFNSQQPYNKNSF